VKIDLDQIQELLEIVSKTDITELSIQIGEEKVTIKKASGVAQVVSQDAEAQTIMVNQSSVGSEISFEPKSTIAEVIAEPLASTNGLVSVISPMVGTFYRSPSPTAPPYVEVGDRIVVGQTVCIIEAMKLMNDMPSEVEGRIVKICVDNGSTVEYGQPLFLVDPKG
jgi:acetyl-CoA carboxylase biotin carboxyl carrier protein